MLPSKAITPIISIYRIQAYKLPCFPSSIEVWNALPTDTALAFDLESSKID